MTLFRHSIVNNFVFGAPNMTVFYASKMYSAFEVLFHLLFSSQLKLEIRSGDTQFSPNLQ